MRPLHIPAVGWINDFTYADKATPCGYDYRARFWKVTLMADKTGERLMAWIEFKTPCEVSESGFDIFFADWQNNDHGLMMLGFISTAARLE